MKKYMLLALLCLALSTTFVYHSMSRTGHQFPGPSSEAGGEIAGPKSPFKEMRGAQANSSGAIQT